MSLGPYLFRFGPALIILLAAIIYAGAPILQRSKSAGQVSASVSPEQLQRQMLNYKLLAPKPPQEVCDSLPHYTPTISIPLYGSILSLDHNTLKIKTETGSQTVMLTSTTRIMGLGKPKPAEAYRDETSSFTQKSRACNDGTRVYLAPDRLKEIQLTAGDLKAGIGVQVLMDETVGSGKTQAAYVMSMVPLKP